MIVSFKVTYPVWHVVCFLIDSLVFVLGAWSTMHAKRTENKIILNDSKMLSNEQHAIGQRMQQ